tara:strand:+ start:3078 stop:3521 length:444 start_codon:yes stop_codon:yes gene_type:complete
LSLLNSINQDLKSAMLAKDSLARDTLRMLIAEIKKFQIDNKVEAADKDVLSIINKMIKQRKDSIDQFTKGNRDDLANTEREQLEVIQKYLPEQLSDKEVEEVIKNKINVLEASSMQDMGNVMGALKSELAGKADMSLVSELVKKSLQ